MNQITIKNNFISLTVLDYGAIVQRILVKDKSGRIQNVVVGFDDPMAYLNDTVFLGACVGRYAGRIKGRLLLDDRTYPLHTQNGVHLHGGQEGFGKKYWSITAENHGSEPFVKLSYLSPDMEEGYPGNLQATALYQLIDQELHITHEAVTDRTTVVNLTNHSYFQLDETDSLKDHQLFVNCSERLETQDDLVPTGNRVPVQNSAYDFLSYRSLSGVRLDTPYVIDDHTKEVATMYSLTSGIQMQVVTNQPAIVIYTPKEFPAICFETQNYPDAPNQPHFPSSRLQPGETYHNHSVFKFGFVN